MKKLVAVGITSKIDKMTALGPPFSQKVEFFIDFGTPRGPKNPPQGASHIDKTPSWNQLGTILGAKPIFFSFWLSFGVPLGLILGPSGLNLVIMLNICVNTFGWVGWVGWLVRIIIWVGWFG